jgi:hypothetical protein
VVVVDLEEDVDKADVATLGAFATLVPFFGLRSTSKPSNLFGV